jgi:chemotaxis family two-component system sensor kinase Cph1
MKKLVHDLLEYARLGDSFKRQSVDLNVLLKDVLKDLEPTIQHHGANISLGELPLVNGSPHDLKLLFNNLISNALLFKKKETVPEIKIDLEGRSREWVIRISDNGLGIEKKYFEKIFVIFQKLHSKNEYPGTGIGLALCKKIVELHGGNIVVESQIGEGSIFSFTLPKAISA